MTENSVYKFRTDSIHYKAVNKDGGKSYYVEGYISTGDQDLYNDIVTEEAMASMLKQIEERQITVDYDHEAFRDSTSILPVGKIEEAKIDENGLWVKCKLNPASPKFKNLWGSVKEGFVTAFSIAFKPLKTLVKTVGDVEVRLLEDLELLNVALTGVPVNSGAKLTDFGMKSVMLKAISEFDSKEDVNMAEEEKQEQPQEQPEEKARPEESKQEVPEQKSEEKPEEKSEEKPQDNKAVEELTAQLKSLQEKLEKQDAELKSIKEKEVFKAKVDEPKVEEKSEETKVDVLNFIR